MNFDSIIVPKHRFRVLALGSRYCLTVALILLSGCMSMDEGSTTYHGPVSTRNFGRGSTTYFGPPTGSAASEAPSDKTTMSMRETLETTPTGSPKAEAAPPEIAKTEISPVETTIAVKLKSYDEVWDASVAAVLRRHLVIVEQEKEVGAIKAKEASGAGQNEVDVSIDPSVNSRAYTVSVDSINPDSRASELQSREIAGEIKQALQDIGTIALVSARFDPPVKIGEIADGKGEGALSGAGKGAKTLAKPGLTLMGACGGGDPITGLICVTGIGLAAAGAAVGGMVGAVAGAVQGDSAHTIQQKEAQAKAMLTRPNVQETVRDGIEQYAKEGRGPTFVKLYDKGPTVLDQDVIYQDLSAQKIDTVLEITVTSYGIKRVGKSDADPALVVVIHAHARLVRTKTNSVLDDNSFTYESAAKNFSDWSTDNGKPVAGALADGWKDISKQVSDSFF